MGSTSWWTGAKSPPPPILNYLTHSGHDYSPAATPDGKTIAFTSDRDGRPRIWLKELASGREAALTAGPDDYARFAPAGATILFSRTEGSVTSLYKMLVAGGEPVKVAEDVLDGDGSPEGRRIAFVRLKTKEALWSAVTCVVGANGEGVHTGNLVLTQNQQLSGKTVSMCHVVKQPRDIVTCPRQKCYKPLCFQARPNSRYAQSPQKNGCALRPRRTSAAPLCQRQGGRMGKGRLDNETALVTGGTDGIGKAIARRLAARVPKSSSSAAILRKAHGRSVSCARGPVMTAFISFRPISA